MDLAAARARHDQVLFGHLAEPATYRPAGGGEPVAVRVLFRPEAEHVGAGGYVVLVPEIQVSAAEITPAKGGTFVLAAGAVWLVDALEPKRERWVCTLRRGS